MVKMTSIKSKLMLISLVTTGMALLAASSVFVVHEAISFRTSILDELTVQADMLGRNSTVALAFKNRKDADEILEAVSASPNIMHAAIYAKSGIFAVYHRPARSEQALPSLPPPDGAAFETNEISLARPILLDNERLGTIYIQADLREFYSRLTWHAVVAILALGGSLLLAFLLLSKLQRTITAPILELVQLTGAVSSKKDYSLRCAVAQEDETGRLALGFNEMLSQIQMRDEELKKNREQLEERVAQRTAELARTNDQLQKELAERKRTEDQLRHSQKMEAVGRLSGGVAHDFNNILTAIIGYGTLLQMHIGVDDPMRHNIDEILASAKRAAALTQSLLAFSRKQAMNPKPVDLPLVIERISKLLQRLIGEDITLVRKGATENLVVVADSGQLEQVLMNLATNARDAMPEGGQLIIDTERTVLDEQFLATHEYMKPGVYARVTVSDTGTGMDRMTAVRVFEPFFTTKEVGKGTGLGLSIVHGIIKQHDGYINVYSEPGHGTTFKIYLPLAEAAATAGNRESVPEIKRGSETILMAEDDEQIRRLTRSVLETAGYAVIEAVDGADAIEKMQIHRDAIRLLLLDVIMPKKNGREVYEEAKKLIPGVASLFVSGYTADIIHDKGLSVDGNRVIMKPVLPGELLNKIRATLDNPAAGGPSAS
jgi:signal transduction histidine kinase